MIIKQIIEEIKQIKFFTILLDETGISFEDENAICWYIGYNLFFVVDIANIEQASLCLRYVDNSIIQEKFVKFIPVHGCSG